jgi:hypothetical protein
VKRSARAMVKALKDRSASERKQEAIRRAKEWEARNVITKQEDQGCPTKSSR